MSLTGIICDHAKLCNIIFINCMFCRRSKQSEFSRIGYSWTECSAEGQMLLFNRIPLSSWPAELHRWRDRESKQVCFNAVVFSHYVKVFMVPEMVMMRMMSAHSWIYKMMVARTFVELNVGADPVTVNHTKIFCEKLLLWAFRGSYLDSWRSGRLWHSYNFRTEIDAFPSWNMMPPKRAKISPKSSPDPPKSSPGASKIEPGALQDAIF